MIPTRDQVAAFADGQLQGEEEVAVSAAVAADPALQAEVAAHRALGERLKGHLDPVAAEPVPASLAALLASRAPVIDLASVRARRSAIPRWGWVAVPALAASLVLAVAFSMRGGARDGYAEVELASALDRQLASEQRVNAPVRVLLSFRDSAGSYCRAFTQSDNAGIACRDQTGWKLHAVGSPAASQVTEYRQAGSSLAVMQAAQEMAAGPALDAAQEREAVERGWRK